MKKPKSSASSQRMRHHRRRLVGAVWHLHEKLGGSGRTFTLMPDDMLYTPEELLNVDLVLLKRQLLAALNRAGVLQARRGFLIIGLHGEYHPATGQFQLHWHGYGNPDGLEVVRRLKEQPRYRSMRDPLTSVKTKPVRIGCKPLTNLPAPFTYLFQGWWPLRDRVGHALSLVPAAIAGLPGQNAQFPPSPSSPRRMRLPEPAHSLWLLWMDKQRIQDLVLMVGARVVGGRIQLRNT